MKKFIITLMLSMFTGLFGDQNEVTQFCKNRQIEMVKNIDEIVSKGYTRKEFPELSFILGSIQAYEEIIIYSNLLEKHAQKKN